MVTKKTANKYDDLLKLVHNGIDPDQPVYKTEQEEKAAESVDTVLVDAVTDDSFVTKTEQAEKIDSTTVPAQLPTELSVTKAPAKRKRKTQDDYQEVFFVRVDFTHRKPLYITATTHRRLMRIVHLMDESKATISSYVENIILNHLETFKEDIETIYRTNNLNPTE
ncbi:DUF3408 domain-containing protein [Dysgonomonas termitidis]|uniref:DUF3408 domain-containing protein n=1 Tax=Dysgonomonas termitidis TaxID=1516126 RepID=A0ABV9L310_9BACT